MILSVWGFQYALQFRSTKSLSFRHVRHPVHQYLCFLSFQNSFSAVKIKTMLKSFHVLFSLSTVWNCYPRGYRSSTKGATKRSIIAYDEVEDRICEE